LKLLDRYVIRETLVPFSVALTLFTFLVQTRPMLDRAQELLAKGIKLGTVAKLLVLLLPQALGVTLPMAFLAGVLMALGRLSGDREGVALLACGVSPLRLLRPVLLMAVVVGAADMYTLVHLVPTNNQRFRVETFRILIAQSEGDIKPGVFYEGFPGKVVYVRERKPGTTRWSGVLLADTSQPGRPPALTFAESGYLDINAERQQAMIVLEGEAVQYVPGQSGAVYDVARARDVRIAVPAESIFGKISLPPGLAEMTIPELRAAEAAKRAAVPPISPHPEVMQRHQMFSFPVACVVFALIGLALGLHTRKEGMLGGFALGMAGIFVYYGIMQLCASMAKGGTLPSEWARWVPDIVLGAVGLAAIWWRTVSAGREITIALPAWAAALKARTHAGNAPSAAPPRVVVVIRIPDVQLPRPRILDWYVGQRYVNVAVLCFFGLLGLYYISTLIDKSERLAKGQATLAMLVEYFYYSTPQFIVYIVPMAILVAVLATIGGLVRSGELVVMRACGVSLYRAAVPLVMLALVWSGGLFLLDDRVLAHANRKAAELDDAIRGNATPEQTLVASRNWRADEDGRVYYYGLLDVPRQTIYNVSIFETARAPYRLLTHAYITRAVFTGASWKSQSGWVQRFADQRRPTRQSFQTRLIRFPAPDFFRDAAKEPEMMTFSELNRHITEMRQSGLNLAESRVTLQERIAFPFVTIVMTLLGIPFGVTTGRRGALYGMGLAVILGSAYWLVNTFFLAVGQASLLPPVLAAWAANVLFLTAAVYFTLTVRT
jgi:LPS export ABC transporter permease LptG/LPS export ABC transporter permease LptF